MIVATRYVTKGGVIKGRETNEGVTKEEMAKGGVIKEGTTK